MGRICCSRNTEIEVQFVDCAECSFQAAVAACRYVESSNFDLRSFVSLFLGILSGVSGSFCVAVGVVGRSVVMGGIVGGGPVGVVLGGWWCGDGWGCVGCGGRGDGVGGDGVGCRGVGRGNGVVVCVGDVCRRVAKVQAGGAGNRVLVGECGLRDSRDGGAEWCHGGSVGRRSIEVVGE